MRSACLLCFAVVLAGTALARQVPDPSNQPPIARPAYEPDKGPVVAIDEAHKNTHTYGGALQGLVQLLRRDGYRVRPLAEAISDRSLEDVDVLVIAQPGGWEGPDASLSDTEVTALMEWVRRGGSLLLILDHLPAPAGGQRIAAALGIANWHSGYASVNTSERPVFIIRFQRRGQQAGSSLFRTYGDTVAWQGEDALVQEHAITSGRSVDERVDSVMTFGGSAFQLPAGAEPLLVLPQQARSLVPRGPGAPVFGSETPHIPIAGWAQGAVMKFGKGRVALAGEAGVFSGQWPVHPAAADNYKLVLNVMRWLSGIL